MVPRLTSRWGRSKRGVARRGLAGWEGGAGDEAWNLGNQILLLGGIDVGFDMSCVGDIN